MTNDEVKNYLKQVRQLNKAIKIKQDKIQQLNEQAASITVGLTADVIQGGGMNNKSFADAVNSKIDLQNQLCVDIYKQNTTIMDIKKRLDEMSESRPDLANVLFAYYINCWTWERVCVELELSWAHVVGTQHPEALKLLKNYLPSE